MNPLEKYKYWENKAEYDLETAKAMLQTGRYTYVAFMSQQAIEKLIKGIYILTFDKEPPRTHNIWLIFKEVTESKTFILNTNNLLLQNLENYKNFFADLLFYYISERYPDYKKQITATIDDAKAKEILIKTEEVYKWLLSLRE